MILSDKTEAKKLIETVESNIEKTRNQITRILEACDAKEALANLKFDKTALDPLTGEPINFIEMLNQAYSDFVVLKAVKDLMDRYEGKAFELHMGALTGFDIVSTDEMVVAECFATVTAFNNQKIKKDSEKLMQLSDDVDRYIYFYSKDDSKDKIAAFTENYEKITFIRIESF